MLRLLTVVAGVLATASLASAAENINAAGATFPAPIYQRWFEEYHQAHPDVAINYQAIGSGGGIRQLSAGTVDFGASDMPMTDQQMGEIKNFHVLHFPTVLGGVVPVYNIGAKNLKFTGAVIADIFMGKITKWNDAALKKLNPGASLPDTDITVVHRSDGSGTTFVFTDYLQKVSPDWKSKVGSNTSVSWPVGLGGKGNEGVAGQVQQTPNAIGYVDLIYAIQNHMNYGSVQNSAGVFLQPTLETVTAAAAGAAGNMPADFRVSITNAPGKNAYPISTFTWMLIPDKIPDAGKRNAIKDFLHWMLTTGQKDCAALSFAPLPKPVVSKELQQIAKIQ